MYLFTLATTKPPRSPRIQDCGYDSVIPRWTPPVDSLGPPQDLARARSKAPKVGRFRTVRRFRRRNRARRLFKPPSPPPNREVPGGQLGLGTCTARKDSVTVRKTRSGGAEESPGSSCGHGPSNTRSVRNQSENAVECLSDMKYMVISKKMFFLNQKLLNHRMISAEWRAAGVLYMPSG